MIVLDFALIVELTLIKLVANVNLKLGFPETHPAKSEIWQGTRGVEITDFSG
jgi:hypothetical protein